MDKRDLGKFIAINEVADYLGVKISTVYTWIHSKQIPYYKIGRLVKFKQNEIDDWTKSKKVESIDLEEYLHGKGL